jgi:sn-glycerol 3-phosphate transport system ATP-binding protein/multiple sugar transport system ATP-binding protein
MGRAIVRRAPICLFDEPLSNLDAALRAQVRVDIRKLHDRLGMTSVYVTHDQVEAMTLADTMFVLNGGRVEQSGPPLEVFESPRTRFVAGFLGSPAMNFLDGEIEDGHVVAAGGAVRLPTDVNGSAVTLGLRPQALVPDEGGPIAGTIEVVEALGTETYVHVRIEEELVVARLPGDARAARGDKIALRAERVHLFDREGGEALG